MRTFVITVAVMIAAAVTSASAAEKAWYGFHIKPETAGFPLNPVVTSVVIDKIKPNSPAAAQKMQVGDEIIEADGKPVPGTRALKLVALLSKQPGEVLRLRLKRADGDDYSVSVRGIKKPD
jgi:C-terminal processing protease CtpA/Prc